MTTARARSLLAAPVVLMLALLPAAAEAQQRGRTAAIDRRQTPAAIGVHGFSIVLVVGGMQGASASDNVPEAARKALADMKDFLPYKRYQLLDAAWILCCAPNTTIDRGADQVSGRVRGPDGHDYLYTVDPGEVVGPKLNLRFTMREVLNPVTSSINVNRLSDTARLEYARQHGEAFRELDEARLQLRTTKQRFDVGTATRSEMDGATTRARRAEDRVRDLASILNDDQARGVAQGGAGGRGGGSARGGTTFGREIMDSSFSVSPGETVVIGTSRLNGDQALIAILTAATKPGGAR